LPSTTVCPETHIKFFLSDTILSDIIDYDEFLTGRRSEGTFIMFKVCGVCGTDPNYCKTLFLP
jgi:hypothetical protein